MGRHSAPQDEQAASAPLAATVEVASGRHHSADGDAADSVAPRPARDSGTRGDLRLLRERPALRARCTAAAIVPFLLYTVVLVVIGRVDVYLLWVWIPTITAGIAVGALLDSAYRHEP
jgi:hypothetical protein